MKRALRWLLWPLLNWLSDSTVKQFLYFDPEEGCIVRHTIDGFGVDYIGELTPDECRALAWDMITKADIFEEELAQGRNHCAPRPARDSYP